jgi:DNA-binding transcriptional ArsR family regulator
MRADRLLSILMLLQTRGRMTARDLAEQLEVSERTIYRDLDALGMAGIPVYPERGPGGGYSLVDGYQTRLTGLTRTEIRALFLSTTIGPLADLGMARALEDALLKLSASLSDEARSYIEQTRQRFHIDSSWTPHDGNSTSVLSLIQDAIWHDQRIHLIYTQDNGQQQRSLVEPYGLVARAGEWYLVGASVNDLTTCSTYSIECILLIEPTEQPFVRPVDFDLTAYWTAYQRRDGRWKQQVHPRMPQGFHEPHQQQRQQRRIVRGSQEKKATRPQTRFVHAHSKKTNYGSQKTGNGRSPFKKKSVSLQPSQLRSNTPAFKKNDIKKQRSLILLPRFPQASTPRNQYTMQHKQYKQCLQ